MPVEAMELERGRVQPEHDQEREAFNAELDRVAAELDRKRQQGQHGEEGRDGCGGRDHLDRGYSSGEDRERAPAPAWGGEAQVSWGLCCRLGSACFAAGLQGAAKVVGYSWCACSSWAGKAWPGGGKRTLFNQRACSLLA
jgi:hypothetical protein